MAISKEIRALFRRTMAISKEIRAILEDLEKFVERESTFFVHVYDQVSYGVTFIDVGQLTFFIEKDIIWSFYNRTDIVSIADPKYREKFLEYVRKPTLLEDVKAERIELPSIIEG